MITITWLNYLLISVITVGVLFLVRVIDMVTCARIHKKPITGKQISKLLVILAIGVVFPPAVWLFIVQTLVRILLVILGKFSPEHKTSMSGRLANTLNRLAGTRYDD